MKKRNKEQDTSAFIVIQCEIGSVRSSTRRLFACYRFRISYRVNTTVNATGCTIRYVVITRPLESCHDSKPSIYRAPFCRRLYSRWQQVYFDASFVHRQSHFMLSKELCHGQVTVLLLLVYLQFHKFVLGRFVTAGSNTP